MNKENWGQNPVVPPTDIHHVEDSRLLGCDSVQLGESLPTFGINAVRSVSEFERSLGLNCFKTSGDTQRHGVTSQQ